MEDEMKKYCCMDCAYFGKGEVCRRSGEYRTTTKENVACEDFEYDKIINYRIKE